MADSILTARRVRIVLRILGFVLVFAGVVDLLIDFVEAMFGESRLFGDFLFRDALLGAIEIGAGAFLILRAKDLAGFLAEDRES